LASQVNPAFATAPAGKFTDSPGAVWPEALAARLGVSITNERFEWGPASPLAATNALVTTAAATNYAQGGARVTDPAGIGCGPVGGVCTSSATVPAATQVTRALAKGNFQPTDLVFFWAGANDVLANRNLALAEIATRVATAEAAAGRALTDTERSAIFSAVITLFTPRMEQAAAEAVVQIKRLQTAGARRLVGMTLPNLAKTPLGVANPSGQRPLLDAFSVAFNTRFKADFAAAFPDTTQALLFDAGRFADVLYDDPAATGLSNRDVPVCSVPASLGSSSLFCFRAPGSPFINPAVDATKSMFADGVHPSLAVHAKLATSLYDELKDRAWVK
jgi:outer membrane lipase/esterase